MPREENMKPGVALALLFGLLAMHSTGTESWAGSRVAGFRFSGEMGGGPFINLIVRQVSFTPAVAHVGETIRVEVVLEDVAEGQQTLQARILANKKRVASKLFTFGWSKGERIYKETFLWDTKGVSPGEYKITADFFLHDDSSPFDNEMTVTQPLILVPAGAPFPDGKSAGGTATERDPRWKGEQVGG
jgi:hypothetical protein